MILEVEDLLGNEVKGTKGTKVYEVNDSGWVRKKRSYFSSITRVILAQRPC